MSISKTGCAQCKKKTLMVIKCKCNKTVCFSCRYPEDHSCSFDYKAEGEILLKKQNPVVVSSKIDKI